jgi:uncharacterized protein (DUF58 family)
MRLRKPGLLLLLSPALSAVLLAGERGLESVVALHVALVAAILAVDALSVRADALGVRRRMPSRISVGETVTVGLEVSSGLRRGIRVTLRDGVPETLSADHLRQTVQLPAGGVAEAAYRISAFRRGSYSFAACWLEVPGTFGLTWRTLRRELPDTVAVIPDVRPLRIYDLQANRALLAASGLRRQRRAGGGGEVARLRRR